VKQGKPDFLEDKTLFRPGAKELMQEVLNAASGDGTSHATHCYLGDFTTSSA
jgi:hypothetical protein